MCSQFGLGAQEKYKNQHLENIHLICIYLFLLFVFNCIDRMIINIPKLHCA